MNNLWNLNNKTIAVLGLSFKPNTDDMRYAPSLDIIAALQKEGAKVRVYDPEAMPKAKHLFKNVLFAKDSYDAVRRADAIAILTEWEEFAQLDWKRVKKLAKYPVVFDGRNILQPRTMKKLGFQYHSIGRDKNEREG